MGVIKIEKNLNNILSRDALGKKIKGSFFVFLFFFLILLLIEIIVGTLTFLYFKNGLYSFDGTMLAIFLNWKAI